MCCVGVGGVQAESRMQNKEWRAASKLLEKACVADSTYAPAFFKLGLCLQKESASSP